MSRTARTAGRVTRKGPPPPAAPAARGSAAPTLTLRVDLGDTDAIGPGKVRLLELVAETGSISAAGRAMGMSYRQAWLLIDSMNRAFAAPVTETLRGGARGGGAAITEFGRRLAALYRAMEAKAGAAADAELAQLAAMLAKDETAR